MESLADSDALWERFETYVGWALNDFVEAHQDVEFKRPTEIKVFRIQSDDYFANVSLKTKGEGDLLRINASDGLVQGVAYGLDISDENQSVIMQWRVFWLVHHELAHWLFGHIHFYKSIGWTAHLALADGAVAPELLPEQEDAETNIVPDGTDFELAHAAELTADTWAIRELFQSIRNEAPDEEEVEESALDTLNRDTQLCYFTILSTVSLFYLGFQKSGDQGMHPSWQLRTLSMLVTLYQSYMRERLGPERIRPGKVLENSVVLLGATDFMEKAIGPAIEPLNDMAEDLGFERRLHDRGSKGFLNPSEFVKVLQESSQKDGKAADIERLYRAYDRLSDLTAEMLAGANMQVNYIYGDKKMTDASDTYDYSLLTDYDTTEARKIVEAWAKENGLNIVEFDTSDGPGMDGGGLIVDLVISIAGALGVEGMKAAAKILTKKLRKEKE